MPPEAGRGYGIGRDMRIRKRIIESGEYREKTAFLFWPKTLLLGAFARANEGSFEETRWLEMATWQQRYDTDQHSSLYWHDLHWIEMSKKKDE